MLAPSQRFPDEPVEPVSLHGRTGAAPALETPRFWLHLSKHLLGRPAVSAILDQATNFAPVEVDLLRPRPPDTEDRIAARCIEGTPPGRPTLR